VTGPGCRRVAVVVPTLAGGGAERVARTLAREFRDRVAVTVVTTDPRMAPGTLRGATTVPWAEEVPPGCGHVHLPSTGSGLPRLGRLALRFAALARREQFDTVYSFLTWTNVVVTAAGTLGGEYVHVASEHAMSESLDTGGRRLRMLAATLPVAYRRPDWIVVVSDAARRSLVDARRLPHPERAVTIPNPVDAVALRELAGASPPAHPGLPRRTGDRVVVCVARLHPQKDHMTLLRAMTLLPPSYGLLVVGDGAMRGNLETTVARFGLSDRVAFTGALENPYPLMRRADVVVLPSREEGFGLVAVEAAVLGVPFVGSAIGGLQEVCDVLGHRTFPPGDADALAAAVRAAMSSPPAEWVEKLAARRFAPGEVAARYLALASAPRSG
jgi:glycosyltransferase involved in cell wall biosynthesis